MNNRAINFLIIGLIIIGGGALLAANYNNDEPGTTDPEITYGDARVELVGVAIDPGDSPDITVTVRGNLPDSCTEIGDITQQKPGSTFIVTIKTERETDLQCAQVLTPFEEKFELQNTDNLAAGDYIVKVNTASKAFMIPTEDDDAVASTLTIEDQNRVLLSR